MNNIIIFCDGGLGNRLGTLIGGLLVSDLINYSPIVCWPENSWCGCSFDDLFEVNLPVIRNNINEIFSKHIDDVFLIHENQTNFNPKIKLKHSSETYTEAASFGKTIVYYHNKISEVFSESESMSKLSFLKIKKSIINKVNSFVLKNEINKSTIGIHLRKTDSMYRIDDNSVINYVKNNLQQKYFVCSDDQQTESLFKILPNTIVNDKTSYVEKFKDGGWNDLTMDNEGRVFNFNVKRSKQSVIEAFEDMLILSKTNILQNSKSSFLFFANKFSNINI
jgi:hypothetical protein